MKVVSASKLPQLPPGVIFIPGHVPSSKNSKVWTGKILINSKQTRDYIKTTGILWKVNKQVFKSLVANLPKPYLIGFHFVRRDKRKYDWVNPLQTIQDLMVTYGWIDDDNIHEMLPVPLKYPLKSSDFTSINPLTPGVYIKVFSRFTHGQEDIRVYNNGTRT